MFSSSGWKNQDESLCFHLKRRLELLAGGEHREPGRLVLAGVDLARAARWRPELKRAAAAAGVRIYVRVLLCIGPDRRRRVCIDGIDVTTNIRRLPRVEISAAWRLGPHAPPDATCKWLRPHHFPTPPIGQSPLNDLQTLQHHHHHHHHLPPAVPFGPF